MTANPFDLSGKTAVVTGGGRGIGRGITESLLLAGADVVVLQRNNVPADLAAFADQAGRALMFVSADLGDPAEVAAASSQILADREIDILINNAGSQFRAPAIEFPLERFDDVLAVNLRSVFQLCQVFGTAMIARREGKIVNIASLLSFQGGITVPAYAASKGAVAQLTKALCNEWAPLGVNVNAIAPGYIDTDMNSALIADPARSQQILQRIPAGRWGTGESIGGSAVFLCSAAARYIHGVVLPVDGGWLAR